MKIVECVPNFSEGRNREVIKKITDAIESVDGVTLLDVDPGESTNRTVVTFVGDPESVLEAAFLGIKQASELIDMRQHKGAHPRMGATDVCPFVPVSGVTIEECVELAKRLGKRVWDELGIPVYLYEYAATRPDRKNLSDIRAGEYEALPEKLKNPDFKPDFGEPVFNAKSGATVIGVRDFLIAYNINLNTKNVKIAREIGKTIREKGRLLRDENGKIVRDENGKALRKPGLFKHCKATGWYLEEFGITQVTMNLTNYRVTPMHVVFDKVCELAQSMGVRVTGSEIVGLVPLEAMLEAGRFFLKKQGASTGVSDEELVHIAIRSLGLTDISEFDPHKKIIEWRIQRKDRLIDMKVTEFVNETGSDSPAPGGGSISAVSGALSAALSSMVAILTYGKKGYEQFFEKMEKVGVEAQRLKKVLLAIIDEDTDAFNEVMAAFRLPKKTPDQKEERKKAINLAQIKATKVPLKLLETVVTGLPSLIYEVVQNGNQNSLSDAGVACLQAMAAMEGAYYNVLINLPQIDDSDLDLIKEIKEKADTLLKTGKEKLEEIKRIVDEKLMRGVLEKIEPDKE